MIINKFRGDVKILEPGLRMLEDIIKVPVAGVVPYMQLDVDDEDSLTDRFSGRRGEALIDIAVIRLPRISNFTDFNALEYIEGVGVRYVGSAAELGDPDLVILPGTKNTMADLLWLRQSGMEAAMLKLHGRGTPIFGVCGGYQMLGQSLSDPPRCRTRRNYVGHRSFAAQHSFAEEKVRTAADGVLST